MNNLSQAFYHPSRYKSFALEFAQSVACGSALVALGSGMGMLSKAMSAGPLTLAMGSSLTVFAGAAASYSLLRLRSFNHGEIPHPTGQRMGISAGIITPLLITGALHSALTSEPKMSTNPVVTTAAAEMPLQEVICRATSLTPHQCRQP
jgi:hypothetical protein